jgi:hypothetical protein
VTPIFIVLSLALAVGLVFLMLLLFTRRPSTSGPHPPLPPSGPTAPGPGVIEDRYVRHQAVADRYHAILAQDVATAAGCAARRNGPVDDALLSLVTAGLCRAMFAAEVDPAALHEILDPLREEARAARLAGLAAALHREAAALGEPRPWDFTFTPGEPLDPHRQEPWLDCDPDGPGPRGHHARLRGGRPCPVPATRVHRPDRLGDLDD